MSSPVLRNSENISNIKSECLEGFCQCCLSENNLRSMLQAYECNDGEVYAEMLKLCFSIEIISGLESNDVLFLICEPCVSKLKESYAFRNQIEEVQLKLKKTIYELDIVEDDILQGSYPKQEKDIQSDECSWNADTDKNTGPEGLMNEDFSVHKRFEASSNMQKFNKIKKKVVSKSKTRLKLTRRKLKNSCVNDVIELKGYLKKNKLQDGPKQFTLEKTAVTRENCIETFPIHRELVSHMDIIEDDTLQGSYLKQEKDIQSDECSWNADTDKNTGSEGLMNEEFLIHKRFEASSNMQKFNKIKKKVVSKSKTRLKLTRRKLKNSREIVNDGIESKEYLKKNKLQDEPKQFTLEKTAVTCEICIETFPIHRELVSHMATHFPNYVCDLCGKPFLTSNGLKNHLRSHIEEKIACKICNKKLKQNSMLRHIKTHNGETDIYACPYCSERFVTFSLRLRHLSEAHDVKRRRYKCSSCTKTFSLSHHRSAHVRKHHLQERNHICTECGKAFFGSSRLKEHMMLHTGERKFQCEVCFKSYPRKYTLSEHMKIHNNVRPHVCSICDKAFTQKCTLKGHMKTHEKEYSKVLHQI